MKHTLLPLLLTLLISCKKDAAQGNQQDPGGSSGLVSGKVTDAENRPLKEAKITIEHTVWYDKYLFATSNAQGTYQVNLPADPAGDWTAKAQLERTAYGQTYKFDLLPDNTEAFSRNTGAVRNFTWKLTGQRPGSNGFYGAHVDLYLFGTDVPMDQVKLVFTPFPGEDKLIDGSPTPSFERPVEEVAGTFMAKDIPIGKYKMKILYPGKKLLLDNRHEDDIPEAEKTVVFGKNGNLAETEYNIEFFVTEQQ